MYNFLKYLSIGLTLALAVSGCNLTNPTNTAVRLVDVPHLGNGSGTVISPGYVLTVKHVAIASKLAPMYIEPGHIKVTGYISSPDYDLAVLIAPGVECPCAKLASDIPNIGDKTTTIGFPLNNSIVIQLTTAGKLQGWRNEMIAATDASTFGNSGGATFDSYGQLIGVLVQVPMQIVPQGIFGGIGVPLNYLSYSVSVNTVRQFLKEYFVPFNG